MPRRSYRGSSTASTATLKGAYVTQSRNGSRSATMTSEDFDMMDIDSSPTETSASRAKKFYIAVDYGTTYSAVSFVVLEPDEAPQDVGPDRIRYIENYPNDPRTWGSIAKEVPTELLYLPPTNRGTNINGGRSRPQNQQAANPVTDYDDEDSDDIIPYAYDDFEDPMLFGDLVWGFTCYAAQDAVGGSNDTVDAKGMSLSRISRAKLLLDNSEHTQEVRDELMNQIQHLKQEKRIKKNEDIITDFLTELFRHVKSQLEKFHGYTAQCNVEFTLCVPPIWSRKACRTMHNAMATALRKSSFISRESGGVHDLFIVSEPEAAATFILTSQHNRQMRINDTFLLLDAGGGTVDAITYSVQGRAREIRLKKEEVEADGRLCGSSFINKNFYSHVKKRLEAETYLNTTNKTIEQIIESDVMGSFEFQIKRNIKFGKGNGADQRFSIGKLRENRHKGFGDGVLEVGHDQMREVFSPVLKGVLSLMESQLELAQAMENGPLLVDKVVLIGGFAGSPALVDCLEIGLRRLNRRFNSNIELIKPSLRDGLGVAVASGAVLRALDKRNGPARTIQSSYGILCREIYDDKLPGHTAAEDKVEWDEYDGEAYVNDTLVWLIKKGETLPSTYQERIPMHKIISLKIGQSFVCTQSLYVSDVCRESNYQKYHAINRGRYELVGKIRADMSFLKKQNKIQPIFPDQNIGKPHYKVEFDVIMEVIDRNLYYKAVWPIGSDQVVPGSEGWTNIAAAFLQGTQ